MIKRIYVIEYDIIMNYLTTYNFCNNAKIEHHVLTFQNTERDVFIQKYLSMKDKESILNLKTGFANVQEIEDMDTVINAV